MNAADQTSVTRVATDAEMAEWVEWAAGRIAISIERDSIGALVNRARMVPEELERLRRELTATKEERDEMSAEAQRMCEDQLAAEEERDRIGDAYAHNVAVITDLAETVDNLGAQLAAYREVVDAGQEWLEAYRAKRRHLDSLDMADEAETIGQWSSAIDLANYRIREAQNFLADALSRLDTGSEEP